MLKSSNEVFIEYKYGEMEIGTNAQDELNESKSLLIYLADLWMNSILHELSSRYLRLSITKY